MSSFKDDPILNKYHLNGWLKKLGGPFQAWKRRYFELEAGYQLTYKVDPSDSKPKGSIDLSLATSISQDPNQPEKFYIYCTNRTWTLMSDSPHETYQWVQELTQLLNPETVSENPQESILVAPTLPNISMFDDTELKLVDIEKLRLEELEALEAHRIERERAVRERQKEREERELQRQRKAKEREEERKRKMEERKRIMEEELNKCKLDETPLNDHINDMNDPENERKYSTPIKRNFLTPQPSPDIRKSEIDLNVTYSALLEKFFNLENEYKSKISTRQAIENNIAQYEKVLGEKIRQIEEIESRMENVQSLKLRLHDLQSTIQMMISTHSRYTDQKKYHEDLTDEIYNEYKSIIKETEKLDLQILEKEDEIFQLEKKLNEVDLKLCQMMVKRVKSNISDEKDLKAAIEFQEDSLQSLKAQFSLLEQEMKEQNEKYGEEIKGKTLIIEDLSAKSDQLRFKLQQLRSKSILDDEIFEEDLLEQLEKEYFISLANSIKLSIIREGYVLQQTSPSELYETVKEQKVPKDEWPRWVSMNIRNRIVKDEIEDKEQSENISNVKPPSRKIKHKKRRVAVTGVGFNNFIAEG